MINFQRRFLFLAVLVVLVFLLPLAWLLISQSPVPTPPTSLPTTTGTPTQPVLFLPFQGNLAESSPTPPSPSSGPAETWLEIANHYRSLAGVPPVEEDQALSAQCLEHARYMAENNVLTHEQDPALPSASEAGQACAMNSNSWLGSPASGVSWSPADSFTSWMGSTGHRLWLIYPTTQVFGYGFFATPDGRAAAALDILSRANFDADETYSAWPVRYPAPDQQGIPPTPYPITLLWRYFGPQPEVTSSSLTTASGQALEYTLNPQLPAGHKGFEILPNAPLPPGTTIVVSASGAYEGQPFTQQWEFTTLP